MALADPWHSLKRRYPFLLTLFRFSLNLFLPLNALQYYFISLFIWTQITISKDIRYRLLIKAIIAAFLYEALLLILCEQLQLDDFGRLVNGNVYYHIMPGINYMAALASLICADFYRRFYLHGQPEANWLLYGILFQKKTNHLIWELHNGTSVYDLLLNFARQNFRLIQFFIIVLTNTFTTYVGLIVLWQMYQHRFYFLSNSITAWLTLGQLLFNTAIAGACFFSFAHIFAIIYLYTAVLSFLSAIKLKQQCTYLEKLRVLDNHNLCFFRFKFYQTLLYLFTSNQFTGCILLEVLAIFTPTSVQLIMLLSLGYITGLDLYYAVFFLFFQQFSIIFLHFLFSYYSVFIHRPVRLLFGFVAKRRLHRRLHLLSRLKLAHLIFALHSNRRYGVSYGKDYSTVTLLSFARFLIIYFKCCLISYKLYMRLY